MTFNFLGPGLTVNVEAKVKEQIILDSSDSYSFDSPWCLTHSLCFFSESKLIVLLGAP